MTIAVTVFTSKNKQHEFNLNITDEIPLFEVKEFIRENDDLDITGLKIVLDNSSGVVIRGVFDEYSAINNLCLEIIEFFEDCSSDTLTYLKIDVCTLYPDQGPPVGEDNLVFISFDYQSFYDVLSSFKQLTALDMSGCCLDAMGDASIFLDEGYVACFTQCLVALQNLEELDLSDNVVEYTEHVYEFLQTFSSIKQKGGFAKLRRLTLGYMSGGGWPLNETFEALSPISTLESLTIFNGGGSEYSYDTYNDLNENYFVDGARILNEFKVLRELYIKTDKFSLEQRFLQYSNALITGPIIAHDYYDYQDIAFNKAVASYQQAVASNEKLLLQWYASIFFSLESHFPHSLLLDIIIKYLIPCLPCFARNADKKIIKDMIDALKDQDNNKVKRFMGRYDYLLNRTIFKVTDSDNVLTNNDIFALPPIYDATTLNTSKANMGGNNQHPKPILFTKEILIKQIAGLRYQSVQGDGHCLFTAVGLYIDSAQGHLRNRIVECIENNMETYLEIIHGLNKSKTPEEYLKDLRDGVEWADDLEISVLMRILDRPIVIVESSGTIRNLATLIGTGEPIFVHYNGHNHYDALILTGAKPAREIFTELSNVTTGHQSRVQLTIAAASAESGNVQQIQEPRKRVRFGAY